MTDTIPLIADAAQIVLEAELQAIQDEITTMRQALEVLERRIVDAQDAEGVAIDGYGRAKALSDPLVLATKDDTNQMGVCTDDQFWKANFPSAAAADHDTRTARDQWSAASALTTRLKKLRDRIVFEVLPQLERGLGDKERELEQHRQQQAVAMEKVRSPGHLEAFRRRLRGEP